MAEYLVSAGELRTRVTFQTPTVTIDSGGAQSVIGYTNVSVNPMVWSHWVYDHGQEMIVNEMGKSVERATVIIRYRKDVLSSWSVLDQDGSRWHIISPPENVKNLNRWTVFRVERVKGSL